MRCVHKVRVGVWSQFMYRKRTTGQRQINRSRPALWTDHLRLERERKIILLTMASIEIYHLEDLESHSVLKAGISMPQPMPNDNVKILWFFFFDRLKKIKWFELKKKKEKSPSVSSGELCFLQPVCEDKVHPDLSANIYSLDVRINALGPCVPVHCTRSPLCMCMSNCMRVKPQSLSCVRWGDGCLWHYHGQHCHRVSWDHHILFYFDTLLCCCHFNAHFLVMCILPLSLMYSTVTRKWI